MFGWKWKKPQSILVVVFSWRNKVGTGCWAIESTENEKFWWQLNARYPWGCAAFWLYFRVILRVTWREYFMNWSRISRVRKLHKRTILFPVDSIAQLVYQRSGNPKMRVPILLMSTFLVDFSSVGQFMKYSVQMQSNSTIFWQITEQNFLWYSWTCI